MFNAARTENAGQGSTQCNRDVQTEQFAQHRTKWPKTIITGMSKMITDDSLFMVLGKTGKENFEKEIFAAKELPLKCL